LRTKRALDLARGSRAHPLELAFELLRRNAFEGVGLEQLPRWARSATARS
jgi:hypothetical protein